MDSKLRSRCRLIGLVSLGIFLGGGAGLSSAWANSAQKPQGPSDLIHFQVEIAPDDPFDPANQIKGGQVKEVKVRRGQVVKVVITARLKNGYHTYPLTQRTEDQYKDQLSQLLYPANAVMVPLWPVLESEPEKEDLGPEIGVFLEHKKPFTWVQDWLILPEAAPGSQAISFTAKTYVCDQSCQWVHKKLTVQVEVTSDPPLPVSAELAKRLDQKAQVVVVVPGKAKPTAAAPAHGVSQGSITYPTTADYKGSLERIKQEIQPFEGGAPGGGDDADLMAFVLAGVFWGFISLITPCVFPMIPITVSFFLKESEKEHHRPVTMALVYCGTIIIVLTIAAVALLNFFRFLSINPWMNFGLGLLFVYFALSLFGMYEIELPSGLSRFTSAREGQGGVVGTVFMALTFTIISFACVAPFLGGFGGTAGTIQRPLWHSILGGLAFSVTFAGPFFFLALFPTLLKKMPKSGSWLNAVKVVMGFLELAAAIKFFRAGELLYTVEASLFTYDLALGFYVVLAFLCGLYLLGLYRLPHDTPEENLGVPRLIFSCLFLALGLYLTPALLRHNAEGERQRPSGTIFAWVDSFLLPEAAKGEAWMGNLEFAVAQAREHRRRTGQPKQVFIDFTGKS